MRRRQSTVVAFGLLVASVLAWAGTASAAPSPTGISRSSHERIVKYWTAERRASAIPGEMVRPAAQLKGKPGSGGGGGTVTGATWTGGGNVVKTTGKVFFTMGGSNYVCSGSAIAGRANLVLSAGHCVWNDSAGFATNWMFAPGYTNGTTLYGAWTATALFTTSGWHQTGNRDFPNDAGIAVVTNGSSGSGGTLAGVLGAPPSMGTSTSVTGTTFSAFGYPAAKKYHGETLIYCQGPGQLGYDGDNNTVSIACDMTGGSSGGPWFDQAGGTGSITSLNSYGYAGLNRMFGPTFDSQESAAYSAANDGTCSGTEVCTPVS